MSLAQASPANVFMSADAVGGVWTYALELAQGLSEAGVSIKLAILGPTPSSSQLAQAARIERLTLVSTGLPLDWTASEEAELDDIARELSALALHSRADLVHLNAPAHAGAIRWPMPLVVTAHSCVATWWHALHAEPLPHDLAWRARRTADGLAVADRVIVPSRAFAQSIAHVYGPDLPVEVVHNGRRPLEGVSAPAKECVLTAGRLWDPAKRIGMIDEAARLSGIAIHGAGSIQGPNGERPSFPNLKLLGSLAETELAQWYARASVFVSTSKYEPFGLSVLEAAQAGAALVLTKIPTFAELWDGAALFVPTDDARVLSRALTRLRSDPELRNALAHKARARAQHYTANAMLAGTLRVYQEAVEVRTQRHEARSAA